MKAVHLVAALTLSGLLPAQAGTPANEIPKNFAPRTDAWDYERREEMLRMRDGVRLKTVILIPKGAKDAPILLERTPYNAGKMSARFSSPHLAAAAPQSMDMAAEAGYILVFQDIRGKHGSEGEYALTRPVVGPLNSSGVDHATDTYDTIDWLVKNLKESNRRVATIGGSYDGFTALMSTYHPHPALKAAVPIAPMVDDWMGDDSFHNGAFRQGGMLEYIYDQEATRKSELSWWTGTYDMYTAFLAAGSAGALAQREGMEELGYWKILSQHPAYDSYWQTRALDKLFASEPLNVPIMLVCGLFDQEDIYGGPAVFAALKDKDPAHDKLYLVLGPWNHGGSRRIGRAVGNIQFAGDTALWFRRNVMQPFLDHYLKDAPEPDLARVLVYETGADRWQRFDDWPHAKAVRALYLLSHGGLGFEAPSDSGFEDYVADPAKPVPYRPRPIVEGDREAWGRWLTEDQRFAEARPDVLTYESAPLTAPLHVSGQPYAHLIASTSGTDSDWVVKLIDVWPEEYPDEPQMGGYEQMIAGDIFRGRYREDLAAAHPLIPDKPLDYRIRLPNANHVFLPGHRIMVQIQSTWFPLYDRNPQTFVENIFFARPEDFAKATQRVYRGSAIELPVAED